MGKATKIRVRCEYLLLKTNINWILGIARINAVVTDGVTVGHPCCNVHNCEEPLRSNRDRFCLAHADRRDHCRITAPVPCTNKAEVGFRTCTLPDHRQLDLDNSQQHKSYHKLRKLAARARTQDTSEIASNTQDDMFDPLDIDQCGDKPSDGNLKIRARWARRQTHNEQLLIYPCGVILARETMYGSESVSNVMVSAQSLSLCTLSLMKYTEFLEAGLQET